MILIKKTKIKTFFVYYFIFIFILNLNLNFVNIYNFWLIFHKIKMVKNDFMKNKLNIKIIHNFKFI